MNEEYYQNIGRKCFIDRTECHETDAWQSLTVGEHGMFDKKNNQIATWIRDGYEAAEKEFFQPYVNEFLIALMEFEDKWKASVPGPCCVGEYSIVVDGRRYFWE